MAKSIKVRRLVNPHGKKRKKKNPTRRKMTAKQIRHFGTKRQRAALKARRRKNTTVRKVRKTRKRNVAKVRRVIRHKKSNPVQRRKKRNVARVAKRRTRRAVNPAPLVLTLGAVNPPERRIKKVAQKKRKKSKNPRKAKKSRNATRVVVMAPAPRRRKRSNPSRTKKHRRISTKRSTRRSNPMKFFGQQLTAGKMATAVAGGLVGVAAAKLIPPLLPSQVTSTNLLKVVTTIATAWLAGYAAGKVNEEFGSAVMFGGFMQAGSVALNAFLPSVGAPLSLGAIVPGRFPIPQNPILDARNAMTAAAAVPAPVSKSRVASMSGLERAFGSSAF
jgi:hypothetical protein